MSLADFFTSAPYARPVASRSVTFVASTRASTLPGGGRNPTKGGAVGAQITAAIVFVYGQGTIEARYAAREALREKFRDKEMNIPLPIEQSAMELEIVYQILWRALHEFEPSTGEVGAQMFPSVDSLRQLVPPVEINRLLAEYNRYCEEEHPSKPSKEDLQEPQATGPRVVAKASR